MHTAFYVIFSVLLALYLGELLFPKK